MWFQKVMGDCEKYFDPAFSYVVKMNSTVTGNIVMVLKNIGTSEIIK